MTNLKKIAGFLPALALGVTTGAGGLPILETADITSTLASVSGGMTNFMTSAILIVPIVLVIVFGNKIVSFLFGKMGGGRKSRRR